jgi:hypothetical protein
MIPAASPAHGLASSVLLSFALRQTGAKANHMMTYTLSNTEERSSSKFWAMGFAVVLILAFAFSQTLADAVFFWPDGSEALTHTYRAVTAVHAAETVKHVYPTACVILQARGYLYRGTCTDVG